MMLAAARRPGSFGVTYFPGVITPDIPARLAMPNRTRVTHEHGRRLLALAVRLGADLTSTYGRDGVVVTRDDTGEQVLTAATPAGITRALPR